MPENKQQMNYPTLIDAETYTKDATGKGIFLGTRQTVHDQSENITKLGPGVAPVEAPAPLGTPKVAIAEELEGLFSGENLSEEFKSKTLVIFEAALNEKVSLIREALIKESEETIQTELATAVEGLASRLDEYLNYVVEEWMKENKLAVESGIRTEIAESFMTGLKNLFESHYVEVPESKHDVLEDLFAENQQLEAALNEQLQENMNFKQEIIKGQARSVFLEATSDMTSVDAERLASLAESIEFSNAEEFKSKVLILKENYLKAAPVAASETETLSHGTLNESVARTSVVADSADPMSVYMNTLSRQLKKF
jgi:hypothetical protein